jgi:hypothetical protein
MKLSFVTVLTLLVMTTSICAQNAGEHGAAAPMPAVGTSPACGGSLSRQCCEPDVSYCASLWANYCQEKKDCRHTISPRRSICGHPGCTGGCCGFPFQNSDCRPGLCLPSLPCFRLHHVGTNDCAATDCSGFDASCAAGGDSNDLGGAEALSTDPAVGSGVTPAAEDVEEAPPQPEPAEEADAPPPAPTPALPTPDDSARRWFLPFPRVK